MGAPFKFTATEFDLAWQQYFQWVDDNPWYKAEAIKSGEMAGTIIRVPTSRPYSEIGFISFHNLGEKYLQQLAKNLEEKSLEGVSTEEHEQLSSVLTQARARCYAQKFEGAAVGAFNANIIARDLGLADKKEIDNQVTVNKPLIIDWGDSD
jgi:hypothetical protein